jgi:hypothetical protein
MSDCGNEQTVQKIEWLQNSFVTEWPELRQLIEDLSVSSPESTFIRIQIIVSLMKKWIL